MTERDVQIEDNHQSLRNAINPDNPKSKRTPKKHCYHSYLVLYNASLESRYTGFLDPDKRREYLKKRFNKCQDALMSIDGYLVNQGYKSIMPIQQEFSFEDD